MEVNEGLVTLKDNVSGTLEGETPLEKVKESGNNFEEPSATGLNALFLDWRFLLNDAINILNNIDKMIESIREKQLDENLLRSIARELLSLDKIVHQLNIGWLKEREFSLIHKLMRKIPPEIIELKDGEIKRLDEKHFVERRDGKIIIYSTE